MRIAGRLSMTFFLNHLRIICDGAELVDGLLLLVIGYGNVEHLDSEPGPLAPAHIADPPPPGSRRRMRSRIRPGARRA